MSVRHFAQLGRPYIADNQGRIEPLGGATCIAHMPNRGRQIALPKCLYLVT